MENLPAEHNRNERQLSRIETQKIREQVVEKILDMVKTSEIKKWMKEEYGLGIHSQEYYLHKAHQEIKKYHKPKIPSIIGSHIRAYERIARKNEDQDPRVSIMALNSIEKVLKITGSGITGDNVTLNQINVFENIDTDELQELLKRINEKTENSDVIEIKDED